MIQTLQSSGRSSGLGSLLILGHCTRDGVYGETVSQPFLPTSMWVPSSLPHGKRLLSQFLDFFSEEIVPLVAVDSLCLWEVARSGSSHVAIFNQKLTLNFK